MFHSRTLTTLATAVVLAVWGGVAAASTTNCPGVGVDDRNFTLGTATAGPVDLANTCVAWGDKNLESESVPYPADSLSAYLSSDPFGTDYGLIDKSDDAGAGLLDSLASLHGTLGGTFSIDLTGLTDVILLFKVGGGNLDPVYAAFLLADFNGLVSGTWGVSGSNSLSHVSLYANVAPIPLPAAGFLLIGALGGLGLMRRRRKIS